jgi:methylmalonyl-CoA mutase cobalamin-binding subunit
MTDFPALLRALAKAGVEYIVVGGAQPPSTDPRG